ncbi:hypothetical protein [Endozoicomonas numazuensis]|uniref:Uncharacterized protein n=1 Tax=Endozoicomonas numazuensis TaxID=1137799 RepID=A0A081N9F5_9GAMM|nr:hypothetical protein [Endozoicomonas numazuensis]KEQ15078.1 hypothetical protein GZ78_24750 [Endozoicomonas numazuensis]
MRSLVKTFCVLILLTYITPHCVAESSLGDSIPLFAPTLLPDPGLGLEKQMNIDGAWFQQHFSTHAETQDDSATPIITELPDMYSEDVESFIKIALPRQLEERNLRYEVRAPCNQQTRKCEIEIHLFDKDPKLINPVEIKRFKVILGLRPSVAHDLPEVDQTNEASSDSNDVVNNSFCSADMPCPSPSLSVSQTTNTLDTLRETELPELDPDWLKKVHVYQNKENGDNLVLLNNIVYYSGKSLPLLLDLFNALFFYSGPINTGAGYYGHFANTQVLAEVLALGDSLPALIKDHNLVIVSPQVDASGYSLALAVYVTYKYYWDNLVLNKKEMTQADVRTFFAWKLFANIVTKTINELASQKVFVSETDPDLKKMKASLFTSVVTALPYGAKLLISAYTGNNYANHIIKAIPADHLLSCSISTNGGCIQLFFHRILGDADMTVVPATALEPAKKVTSGLSYIPSAMTQAAIGKAFNALGMTVCGGHYIKGAGYAVVDGVDKYLVAQGVSDLTRYTALTGGAVFMSVSNYSFSKAFATGFSNRYAKYLMTLAGTTLITLAEIYFHTTILR